MGNKKQAGKVKAKKMEAEKRKEESADLAAPAPAPNEQPFASIDGVIRTLYECISGPPGGQDWERDRLLFHPRALITRTRIEDDRPVAHCFDFDAYRASTTKILAGRSFHEVETRRITRRFGQIANVLSAYEAKESPESEEVLFRGINMIHLWHGALEPDAPARWWIMAIIWDNEREGVKIKKHWFD